MSVRAAGSKTVWEAEKWPLRDAHSLLPKTVDYVNLAKGTLQV